MWVTTSCQRCAFAIPVPLTAQSTTPLSSDPYTSPMAIATGCAPSALTKSDCAGPEIRTFIPLRSAADAIGFRQKNT